MKLPAEIEAAYSVFLRAYARGDVSVQDFGFVMEELAKGMEPTSVADLLEPNVKPVFFIRVAALLKTLLDRLPKVPEDALDSFVQCLNTTLTQQGACKI